MSIALRDKASGSSGSLEVDVTIPATVQTGDQMIAFWAVASTVNPLTPTGWALLGHAEGSSTNLDVYLLSRTATSGDAGTSVAFAQNVAAGGSTVAAVVLAAYHDTAGTVSVDGSAFGNGTLTMPALTTVADQCVTVGAACVRDFNAPATITWTDPAGYTSVANAYLAGGSGKSIEVAHKLTPVTAGTNVGGGVFTSSSTVTTNVAAMTVALKSVAAPAAGPAVFRLDAGGVLTPVTITPLT